MDAENGRTWLETQAGAAGFFRRTVFVSSEIIREQRNIDDASYTDALTKTGFTIASILAAISSAGMRSGV